MLEWVGSLHFRWRARGARAARVRDLADGALVRVRGVAEADGEPWLLPLSGHDAVTFTLRAESHSGTGGAETPSAVIDEVDRGQTFYVRDESGRVLVDRKGWSTLYRARTFRWSGAREPALEARLEDYFSRYGHEERALFRGFGPNEHYAERAVPVGATVTVVGVARVAQTPMAPDGAAGYRDLAVRYVIEPPDRGRLLIRVEP